MKIVRVAVILLAVYVGVIVLFESMLGYFQPQAGETMVITTFAQDGAAHERVVARLESDNRLYVAVNHWPRAWYRRMVQTPRVQISYAGEARSYRPVRLSGAEYERVNSEHRLGLIFRLLTGFPPRHLFRLDPVG